MQPACHGVAACMPRGCSLHATGLLRGQQAAWSLVGHVAVGGEDGVDEGLGEVHRQPAGVRRVVKHGGRGLRGDNQVTWMPRWRPRVHAVAAWINTQDRSVDQHTGPQPLTRLLFVRAAPHTRLLLEHMVVAAGLMWCTLSLETSEARMGVRKPSRSRKPRAKAWP